MLVSLVVLAVQVIAFCVFQRKSNSCRHESGLWKQVI